MRVYTFPYFVSSGKGDSSDGQIHVELTDEEAERLEASAKEAFRFRLSEDAEIEDIYDKVYAEMLKAELQVLKDRMDDQREFIGDALEIDEDEIDDYEFSDDELEEYLTTCLTMDVNYPEELQNKMH